MYLFNDITCVWGFIIELIWLWFLSKLGLLYPKYPAVYNVFVSSATT